MPEDDRYVIEILDVALNAIDTMASSSDESHSPSSLAKQFNINRSRMFRIFKTLERRDFVTYDPETETYRLGLKFLEIAQNIRSRLNLRREAENILKELADGTGDCSYLIIPSGNSAIVVDRYSGDNLLQLSAPIGSRLPLHAGAAPKVLLAFMPEEQRERVIDEMKLPVFTANTIRDKDTLRMVLAQIREQGYAVDEQDFEVGAYAFGAPVFDHEGNVVAGLSITTPTARCSAKRRKELIAMVRASAKELSEKLGYQSNRFNGK
jgi:DNA-binding IclR family transcriptional regulator